jgi:hypothetical protein
MMTKAPIFITVANWNRACNARRADRWNGMRFIYVPLPPSESGPMGVWTRVELIKQAKKKGRRNDAISI